MAVFSCGQHLGTLGQPRCPRARVRQGTHRGGPPALAPGQAKPPTRWWDRPVAAAAGAAPADPAVRLRAKAPEFCFLCPDGV